MNNEVRTVVSHTRTELGSTEAPSVVARPSAEAANSNVVVPNIADTRARELVGTGLAGNHQLPSLVLGLATPNPSLARKNQTASIAYGQFGNPATQQLVVDGVSPYDVLQGGLADCYVVASLAAIAAACPERIEGMFRDNDDGTYTVTLHGMFGRRRVTIDTQLPLEYGIYPAYARPLDPNELWGPLAEKAYAATRSNGYETMDHGGMASHALFVLTGRQATFEPNFLSSTDRTYRSIRASLDANLPVVGGTYYSFLEPLFGIEDSTLVNNHAYAVIDAYEEDGEKWIVLYNPHGFAGEYRTSRYETDVDVDGDGELDSPLDGVFRMKASDYRRLFFVTARCITDEEIQERRERQSNHD